MYIADAPATGETEPVAAVPSGVHVPERIRWNSEEDTFVRQRLNQLPMCHNMYCLLDTIIV